MRYLADECFDARVARALEASGADVVFSGSAAPGAQDADVLALAAEQDRLLLTRDKDFGALVFRDAVRAPGIVLLRLDGLTMEGAKEIAARILALPDFGRGVFTTIDAEGERTRVLPA